MKFNEVVDHFGSQQQVAVALEVSKGNVSHWKKTKNIPLLRQYQVESITKGKLKADNRRKP